MAICTSKWSSPWPDHDCIGPTFIKSHGSSQTCFCMCSTASCMLYCILCTLHVQNSTPWDQPCKLLEKVSFGTYTTDGYERLCLARSSVERHLTTFLCARYMTEMCMYISCTHGYVFLYVLPRYEACGTSKLVRYIKVYVIASFVIASQFSWSWCCFGANCR